ncbi:hypothetical protein ACFX2J_018142 [Malus domestica]
MWVERSKKSIFIYQDTSKKDPFLPGIQTEWQLQQMIRFGHRNLIAVDSTFGIKRLKLYLVELVVLSPGWKINGFCIDDAATKIERIMF